MNDNPDIQASWPGRLGLFTLIVLVCVVLVVFGSPLVIYRGPVSSPEARTLTEIGILDAAFKKYKAEYGAYPPSDFANLDDTKSPQYVALARHIEKAFPDADVKTEIAAIKKLGIVSPAQALCLWMGGLSADRVHPISGLLDNPSKKQEPFCELDTTRLRFPREGNAIPIYLPIGWQDAPYVYFSSSNYATQAPFNAAGNQRGKGVAKPYRADQPAGGFVNPNSFQIIAAGGDGDYGGGKGSFPSGAGYEPGDYDNLTNFSSRVLADEIPQ